MFLIDSSPPTYANESTHSPSIVYIRKQFYVWLDRCDTSQRTEQNSSANLNELYKHARPTNLRIRFLETYYYSEIYVSVCCSLQTGYKESDTNQPEVAILCRIFMMQFLVLTSSFFNIVFFLTNNKNPILIADPISIRHIQWHHSNSLDQYYLTRDCFSRLRFVII